MKQLLSFILLLTCAFVKAQGSESITLKPYFDPKDKEILLSIDENTGELKGVISLKQPWVDKAFSKDRKFLYTVSANYVTKIDLNAFKIVEEKKFYEKPPKEEWDDSDKYQKALDAAAKMTGIYSSYENMQYTSKYKVASNGNVLFFTICHKYQEKSKELFELKKWKDAECESLQIGEEEWSKIYKIYNEKYAKLLQEQGKYQNWYDVKLYNFKNEETKTLLSDGGNWTGQKMHNLYCSYLYHTNEIISINLIDGLYSRTQIDLKKFNDTYKYTPSSVFILCYDKLYAQFNGSKTMVAPISFTCEVQYEKALLFDTDNEYYKWANPLYYGSANKVYKTEIVKNKVIAPKHTQPPSPDRSKMKRKEYKEALIKWEQESAKNLEKFQKESAEYIKKIKETTFHVLKMGVDQPVLKITDARLAKIYNGNKLLIDRKYELELYDLENKKTIWVTELDY